MENSYNIKLKHKIDILRIMNDCYIPDYLPLRSIYKNGIHTFDFSQNLPKIKLNEK
jgi:hypothetical protein